ncbi:acyltransferase [Vibrio cholerae]|uniref:acyltransferase family protein n=1 Tax=Vibrio cholerae TaxID=666 RepID=UPI0028DA79C4|nr:acyltransferase [Vibrio cholerae]ELJ8468624.1 acyltransferase [Vibrio cholerae]
MNISKKKNQKKVINYRPDIDGLRALAVLSVVLYHAFPSYLQGGFVGVDIFFVISGFLITSILLKELNNDDFKFSDFYLRRFNRIFPSLIVVLIFSFFIGWFIYLPKEFEQLSKHILGGVFFVSNFILLGEVGYFDAAAETKPLLHLWSLGIEEQFYIVWPFLLWFLYHRPRLFVRVIALITLCSFILNVIAIYTNPEVAFYSPFTRFWELLTGAFFSISLNYKSESKFVSISNDISSWIIRSKNRIEICSILGLSFLIIAMLITTKSQKFPGWYALLPTVGSLLIILSGPSAFVNRYILSSRPMVFIGLISFPLYLWHWPILVFSKAKTGQSLTEFNLLVLVFISIFLAWFTYRFVEKPLRFTLDRRLAVIMLLWATTCISLISIYSMSNNGLASRFPEIVQRIIGYDGSDTTSGWRVGECHLLPKQGYSGFGSCDSEAKSHEKPTLLLWGDSHAAHLYQGLIAHYSQKYRIIQKTASTCPPIGNMDIPTSPNCEGINAEMRQYIETEKPDRIILAAAWDVYDWKKLSSTIDWLKQIDVNQIDLVGPVPRWLDSLPRQALVYYSNNKKGDIPVRMNYGLKENVKQLDIEMYTFAQLKNIDYLSPFRILCNQEGCLVRVGQENMSLTAFDSSHLTEDGADYVVSHFNLD